MNTPASIMSVSDDLKSSGSPLMKRLKYDDVNDESLPKKRNISKLLAPSTIHRRVSELAKLVKEVINENLQYVKDEASNKLIYHKVMLRLRPNSLMDDYRLYASSPQRRKLACQEHIIMSLRSSNKLMVGGSGTVSASSSVYINAIVGALTPVLNSGRVSLRALSRELGISRSRLKNSKLEKLLLFRECTLKIIYVCTFYLFNVTEFLLFSE
jgi:hypothetical protein